MDLDPTLSLPKKSNILETGLQILLALVAFFLFLVALELITNAAHQLETGFMARIFQVVGNPFVSLCIGILATAIIQSSSTLTATLVAMVASGAISLEAAVPLVLGANIGTCVTSAMVSFAHIGSPKAFRRGFTIAGAHTMFNVITAAFFFPLEIQWHVLSKCSSFLAAHVSTWGPIGKGWMMAYQSLVLPVVNLLENVVVSQPVTILVCGITLLFMCIYMITLIFKSLLFGPGRGVRLNSALSDSLFSFFSGLGLTAAIHSSGAITSVSVMLAATEKVSPKKLFPVVLGANVGTTITALIASIGRSEPAIAIALTHMLFNVFGVLLIYPFRRLREIPLALARPFANLASNNLAFAFTYLILLFFALPFLVIYLAEKF